MMKKKNLFSAVALSCIVWLSPSFAHAQTTALQGRWTLKEASVTKRNGANTIRIPVDSVKKDLAFFLFDRFECKADTFSSPDLLRNCKGKFLLEGKKLSIPFTPAPLIVEYERASNELRLNQQFTLMRDNYTYRVLTVYKKDNDGTDQ